MARPKSSKNKVSTAIPVAEPLKDELFRIELKLGVQLFNSEGKTMLEALTSLPRPQKILTKGILTISHKGQIKTQFLLPPRTRRLFWSPTSQAIQAKLLAMTLK